jgi:hypothetical protein
MNEDVEITLQSEDVSVETPLVADYILPTASSNTLGGVKIGDNIDIDSGGRISVPIASQSSVGLVKAGTGLAIASDGTLSATGTYDLPEATKTTLGGVYMDDELSTSSTHPVQNAVVSLALADATDDINDLSTDVDNLSTGLGNLSTTVGGLSTTVGNLSTQVTTNTNNIGTNASSISSLNSRMSDAEDNITSLTNGANEMSGNLDTLLATIAETIAYSDIANYWTAGNVTIVGKGKTAYVNFDLDGSLTINAGSYENILEITDDDLKPKYPMEGILITDAGVLKVSAFTSGIFRAYNLSTSNITLTTLSGNIPIILN